MRHRLIQRQLFPCETKQGYIAIVSVIIISAIALLAASSASLFSIGESNMALEENQAEEAFYLADFCAEYALMKIESVLNYSGNETITMGEDSCDILLIGGSGNFNRTIRVQAEHRLSNSTSKIEVEVSRVSPVMEIASWQEVADF
ncbi:MAG: hypothetical protein ABIG08_02365 [bacterium]